MPPDTRAMRDTTRAFRRRMIDLRALASATVARSWRASLTQVPFDDKEALRIALSEWFMLAYQQQLGLSTAAATDAMAFVRAYAEAAAPGAGTIEIRDLDPAEFATATGTAKSLRKEMAGPVIELRTALARGVQPGRALLLGEARAKRTATTVIVRASDQAANTLAKQSGRFRGWRRVMSANPCGACLAAARGEVSSMSEPIAWHPGCRCSRAFVPVGEPDDVLAWVPTGEEAFAQMTPDQQAALFAGRGGERKAALIREGKVPLDALMAEDSRGRTSEESLGFLEDLAASRERRGARPHPIGAAGGGGAGGVGGGRPPAPSGEPGPLPYRENAVVRESKLIGYYLDESRRDEPSSKVGLIRDELGFTDPATLRQALVLHAQTYDATFSHDNGYALNYSVTGPLTGPSGRTIDRFMSTWAIVYGTQTPHNVTVKIAKKGGAQ